jgi:HD superfamily phosphodiesterase
MPLEQEKIVANTKKYFDTATKLGFMNEELMKFLGESFIKAPASTMTDLHNAFEGGLIDHLLRVASYAVKFNNALPDDEKVDQTSLLKVSLLHQIGKANLYKPCESEWHRKNQGKMYEFNDEISSMRVGERSIYYAMSHGVTLTEEEYSAILNFDKTDDKMAEYHNSTIGDLLKTAALFAVKHEKNKK